MWGHWTYLALIVSWAGPIVAAQWIVGRRVLAREWKAWLLTIVLASAWLTAADSVALRAGTWTIAPQYSLGVFLPGRVPIEEGVFFLLTCTLIVQALLLLRGLRRGARHYRPRA